MMMDRRGRGRFGGRFLTGVSAGALLAAGLGAHGAPALAADGFNEGGFGNNSVTWTTDGQTDDVWNIDNATGSSKLDITLDASGPGDNGADGTLTIKSGGGANTDASFNKLSYPNTNDGGVSNDIELRIGNGQHPVNVTAHGTITLRTNHDPSNTLTIDADNNGGGPGADATLDAKGNILVDGGGGPISVHLDDDPQGGEATLRLSGGSAQVVEDHIYSQALVDKGITNGSDPTYRDLTGNLEGTVRVTNTSSNGVKTKGQLWVGTLKAENDVLVQNSKLLVGTLEVDTSQRPVTVNGQVRLQVVDRLAVSGSHAATVKSNSPDTLVLDNTITTELTGSKSLTLQSGSIHVGKNAPTTITAGNRIVVGGSGNTLNLGGDDSGNTHPVTLAIRKTDSFDPASTEVLDDNGNTVNVVSGSTLKIKVGDQSRKIDDGTEIVVTDQNVTKNGTVKTIDTAMLDLSDTSDNANEIAVTVDYRSQPAGATGSAADALGAAFEAAADDPEVWSAIASLSENEAQQAGEQLAGDPTASGGSSGITARAARRALHIAGARLASVRGGDGAPGQGTGLAAGDAPLGRALWVKPYAVSEEQGMRDGVAGYDADSQGLVAGGDMALGKRLRAGVMLGYTQTDVDGKGPGRNQRTIDSYQVGAYGDYTAESWYAEGMLSYTRNALDSTRYITFGGLNRRADADYNSDQVSARLSAGRPYRLGGTHTLTPTAGVQLTHVMTETYTETGAGSLNRTVDQEARTVARLRTGVTYGATVDTGAGTLRPEVRAGVSYDAADDRVTTTSTFTGGGAAFDTRGPEVARFAYSGGLGVAYTTADGRWTLRADYDARKKEDFLAHTGQLEARFNF